MRALFLTLPILLLTACGPSEPALKAVDAASLPPMSGKERALMAAAEGAIRSGDSSSAERDYLEAVAASQGHVEAHLALATLYQSQNQLAKAQAVLERAHAYQPNQPRVAYLLGKIAIQANQPDKALAYFNDGIVSTPTDLDLLNGAGTANDMLRHNAKAQGLYKQAMTQNPTADLSMVRTNLAMSYLLSNEPKKAVQLLKPEAKKPGTSAVTRHNLALAYGMLGKHTEAKALVSKDMTEEDRQMALKRLQLYVSSPEPAGAPPAVVRN